jgi:hypothetical protein
MTTGYRRRMNKSHCIAAAYIDKIVHQWSTILKSIMHHCVLIVISQYYIMAESGYIWMMLPCV